MNKAFDTARALPGFVIGTTLGAARWPLTAVARVARQQDNEEWPPFVAFESAEAAVETAVGSVLGDDALLSRGRLRQARLAKLKQAGQLDAVAAQTRRRADDELEARRDSVERRRDQVEETAQQREQRIERAAEQKKAAVARKATARKTSARKQAATAQDAVKREERQAKLVAADAEAVAVDLERAALEAEDRAITLDEQIDASREARSGS